GAEARAHRHTLTNGRYHRRMGVTENHRSPGADQIEVAASVRVDDLGAPSTLHEDGRSTDRVPGTHGAVHAAGHDPARFRVELLGGVRHAARRWHPTRGPSR